jgi:hypothetical protein
MDYHLHLYDTRSVFNKTGLAIMDDQAAAITIIRLVLHAQAM